MRKRDLTFLWEKWKTFAKAVGNFNFRVILTLFYFGVVGFFSLGVGRWQNYLRMKSVSGSNWLPVKKKEMGLAEAKRQF